MQMTKNKDKIEAAPKLFGDVINKSNDAIFVSDPQTGLFVFVNDNACVRLGYDRRELLTLCVMDVETTFPDNFSWQAHVNELRQRGSHMWEGIHRRKNGTTFPVEANVSHVVLNTREYMVAVVRDITERKQSEEVRRRSEEKFQTLFESATDAVFILGPEGNFIDINRTAYERLGYTKKEMLSMHLSQLDPPDFAAKVSERIKHLMKHGHVVVESAHLRKDGTVMPVEINARMIDYEGKKAIFSIIRDITERKQAEETLRELNARLQALIHAIPDLVIFKDTGGRHLIANKAMEKFTGLSQKELIGKTSADLLPPDLLEACNKSDEEVLKSLKPFHTEEHYTGTDGEKRYFDTIKAPIFLDSPDTIAGIVAVSREITDQKKIEKQIRSSLMEKEVLLKEIHHRVKNNLQIVASMLELQSGYIKDKKAKTLFEESQKRVESMSLIHEKLYRSKDLARIDFKEYVDDLVGNLLTLNTGKSERIEMKVDIEGIMLDVNNSIPCGLIINELVSNALRHAFPNGRGGEITVSMRRDAEGMIALEVGDNGIGFPEGVDFRNTKSLGMQLVISLVDQLDGMIELERTKGTLCKVGFHA
jgi:PAS domain S-box-containing protein